MGDLAYALAFQAKTVPSEWQRDQEYPEHLVRPLVTLHQRWVQATYPDPTRIPPFGLDVRAGIQYLTRGYRCSPYPVFASSLGCSR